MYITVPTHESGFPKRGKSGAHEEPATNGRRDLDGGGEIKLRDNANIWTIRRNDNIWHIIQ